MSWHLTGTTLESCNCEAICPCRRIDGTPGGRSDTGECTGALSWLIDRGEVEGVDVAGLAVVMVIWYSDDEPGSPWRWVLHVDERGDDRQRAALESVFSGERGGTPERQFPWAYKPSNRLAVVPSAIHIDHTPGRGWFRADSAVTLQVRAPYVTESTVTCLIPGHDRTGRELVCERLQADDEYFAFEFEGRCGFESSFDYSSD